MIPECGYISDGGFVIITPQKNFDRLSMSRTLSVSDRAVRPWRERFPPPTFCRAAGQRSAIDLFGICRAPPALWISCSSS